MRNKSLRLVLSSVVLSLATTIAFASSAHTGTQPKLNNAFIEVPFPTAGDAFCGSNFCGNLPPGGQTDFMFTTGNFVISSIFVIPTHHVLELDPDWFLQNDLTGSNTETFEVSINGVERDTFTFSACGDCVIEVIGQPVFFDVGPLNGGYQIELLELNTVAPGGGSIAWLDGGENVLSYIPDAPPVPEPGSFLLLGSGVLALAAAARRKLLYSVL